MIEDVLQQAAGAVGAVPWPAYAAVGGGLAVLLVATGLAFRATSRSRGEAAARWSTRLIGGSGIAVASFGVVMFLRDAGLPWPLAILGSVLVEGGIARFAMEVYRATRAGEDATVARRMVWLAVAVSAVANVTHAPVGSTVGSWVFAAFPLFGAMVVEFDASVIARSRRTRQGGPPPRGPALSRLAAAAWTRLWATVAARLGLDVDASDTDVERSLRAQKAGRLLYALRMADRGTGWLSRARVAWLHRRVRAAYDAANIPADAAMHRMVLRTMRTHASLLDEARDEAPYEPWTLVPYAYGPGAGPAYGNPFEPLGARDSRTHMSGPAVREVTSGAQRTDPRTDPRTAGARDADDTEPRTPVKGRTTERAYASRGGFRTRTNRPTADRTSGVRTPDVTELVPYGQQVYAELLAGGQRVTRDRLAAEIRSRGHTLGAARASALWAELNNGHAQHPASDG